MAVMTSFSFRIAIVGVALALLTPAPGSAAEWPSKPIRLVVPFGPAGVADLLGRIVAEHLQAELKQTVVVENRGGAAGLPAAALVARSDPDGYTLLLSGLATNVIAAAVSPNPGFDTLRDFVHIAYLGGPPIGWIAAPSTEIRSVEDVLRLAREGKLVGYATSGTGTLGHLVTEYVVQKTGTPMTQIPYNTAVFTDLIAGRVPLASYAWSSVMGQVQGGTVRAIAVTSETRLPNFAEVPTFKELGYDLVARTWFALSGPKGMPADIVERINKEVIKMFERQIVRDRMAQQAVDVKPMTPEELSRHFESEVSRWTPIARSAGMKK
jgi:tripartite-type tricarboxylate transporter receptor subunit TctC